MILQIRNNLQIKRIGLNKMQAMHQKWNRKFTDLVYVKQVM